MLYPVEDKKHFLIDVECQGSDKKKQGAGHLATIPLTGPSLYVFRRQICIHSFIYRYRNTGLPFNCVSPIQWFVHPSIRILLTYMDPLPHIKIIVITNMISSAVTELQVPPSLPSLQTPIPGLILPT